jgi:serine/threonine protein kinase
MDLRIRGTPVISYDKMKEVLEQKRVLNKNITNGTDYKEKYMYFFTENDKEKVLKLGNHERSQSALKYNLVKNEIEVYKMINTLINDRDRFPEIYNMGCFEKNDQENIEGAFCYIIMERVQGDILTNFLEKNLTINGKQFSTNVILTIMLNLTLALKALSSLGYIHRDLSMDNIIVQNDLNIKIIDFETSKNNIAGEYSENIPGEDNKGYFYLLDKIAELKKEDRNIKNVLNKVKDSILIKFEEIYENFENIIKHEINEIKKLQGGGKRKSSVSRKRKNKTLIKARKNATANAKAQDGSKRKTRR